MEYRECLIDDENARKDELEVAELLKRDVTAEHELDLVVLKNSADIDSLSVALRADFFRYKVAHYSHVCFKREIVLRLVDEVTL